MRLVFPQPLVFIRNVFYTFSRRNFPFSYDIICVIIHLVAFYSFAKVVLNLNIKRFYNVKFS